MPVRPVRRGAIVAGVATAAVLAACGGTGQAGGPPPDGRIPVVASTNVWGSVVSAVGGDAVAVRSIIDDPSADPHSYESKPADATAVAGAKLAVYNGHGYDDFFTKLLSATGDSAKTVVAFDLSGQHGADANEHVWYDLATVEKVADTTATDLAAIRPDQRDTFLANAKSFDAKLETLKARIAQIGTGHPGARALVTESVPDYLLKAAGIADVTPPDFTRAIEQETDPSADAVAKTTALVTGKQIDVLVDNAQTESQLTDALKNKARAAGIPVVEVTETLPQNSTGYLDWMTSQVNALAAAVGTR